ncbi:MAG: tyrosine-type recombinase/integrase, partial [Ruminiclostridium sp.]|nr:tyrosine-type recombinase/integrase [Ruminiclostridium sp.]
MTPHMLRHTFCTEMAMRGLNVKTLQYIMGHSNISTTLNIYTHVAFDQVESSFNEVVEKREDLAE